MKRCTIVYLSSAEANLVAAWQAATNRAAISKAADDADRILSEDPTAQATLLAEGL